MVSFKSALAAVSTLALASFSNAQYASWTNTQASGYSVKFSVPPSGDDIFLQLNGPSSAGWVGTGIGVAMKGALIFVIYSDGAGNVTASARLGLGEFEPEFESSINYELLEGSGISKSIMTANIRCANCRKWSGGSLNVNSTAVDFLWSVGNDEKIATTDKSATIHQHKSYGFYTLNLEAAVSRDTINPFLSSNDASTTTNTTAGGSSSTTSETVSTSGSVSSSLSKADKIFIAHGVIMAVTFALLFPFGAALIRILNNRIPNAFALHRGVQILNLILAFVGMGMGIWGCNISGQNWRTYHQVMGVIIVCLLPLQAVLGHFHHLNFLQTGKRSFWSYGHIWFGRLVIILGIVNGGIGLGPELADAPRGWVIAYLVVVSLMAVLYVTFYLLKERSRKQNSYDSAYDYNYKPAVHGEGWH